MYHCVRHATVNWVLALSHTCDRYAFPYSPGCTRRCRLEDYFACDGRILIRRTACPAVLRRSSTAFPSAHEGCHHLVKPACGGNGGDVAGRMGADDGYAPRGSGFRTRRKQDVDALYNAASSTMATLGTSLNVLQSGTRAPAQQLSSAAETLGSKTLGTLNSKRATRAPAREVNGKVMKRRGTGKKSGALPRRHCQELSKERKST